MAINDRRLIHLAACSLVVALPVPAFAEDTPPLAAPAAGQDENSADTSADIIVTATKQGQQALQKVPISITAITEKTLRDRGAESFADYARLVPGLSFVDSGPGDKQYVLRGVNSNGTGVATVGQYVDDILITGDLRQPDLRLFDVQRVEVLRGPQGTLYGSGSLSGTIRTITNRPDPTGIHLDVEGRFSGTEHGGANYQGNALINLPIVTDKIALRVVGYGENNSGFIDNIRLGTKDINEETTYGGRASLRFVLGPDTNLTGNIFYQSTHLDGRNIVTTATGQKYKTDQYVFDPFDDHFAIYNLTLDHNFGALALTASSSYFDRRVSDNFDSTPFDLSFGPTFFTEVVGLSTPNGLTNQTDTSKLFTNEVRLATTGTGRLNGVIGVFQQNIRTTFNTLVATTNAAGYLNQPLERIFGEYLAHTTDQYAIFGEVSYKLTDKLTFLTGLRWFDAKEKDDRASTYPFGGFAPPSVEPTLRTTEHKLTPKFYLSYQANNDVLVFATASQGFRIGGGNQNPIVPLPLANQHYSPDSLWNYELGTKTSWFNRRLTLNASIYYIDWSNIQVSDFTDDSNAFTFTSNAGAARVYGAELEASARPIPGLDLGATLAYVNAELTEDQPSLNSTFGARKGNAFPNVPRWSGSFTGQYSWSLTNRLQGVAHVDYTYTGDQGTQFNPASPLYNRIDSYSLVNVRLGVRSKGWDATLFVNNLFDKYAATNIIEEASDLTPRAIVPIRPRTGGIALRYHF
ncbi:MAG: TonB-dependent receptor [Sphingomonas sp.]